jgi:hypothetical protein
VPQHWTMCSERAWSFGVMSVTRRFTSKRQMFISHCASKVLCSEMSVNAVSVRCGMLQTHGKLEF